MNNSIGGYYADNAGIRKALEAAGVAPGSNYDDENKVTIDETIVSIYAMQTFDMDFGSIVGALQEDTSFDTEGVISRRYCAAADTFEVLRKLFCPART